MASLRRANKHRTICEVLREVNDILQHTSYHQPILVKLMEAEGMAKRMSKALYKYNKKFDKGWWEKNPDYEKDLKKRLDENYIVG
jgi:hypothetical protein